jgi:hypothetical protein
MRTKARGSGGKVLSSQGLISSTRVVRDAWEARSKFYGNCLEEAKK